MPFTYQEAEKLCREYQYLIGTKLNGDTSVVECIAITPLDFVKKQRFFMYYLLFDNDAEMALAQDSESAYYDVEVISRNVEDGIVHNSIHQLFNTAPKDFMGNQFNPLTR